MKFVQTFLYLFCISLIGEKISSEEEKIGGDPSMIESTYEKGRKSLNKIYKELKKSAEIIDKNSDKLRGNSMQIAEKVAKIGETSGIPFIWTCRKKEMYYSSMSTLVSYYFIAVIPGNTDEWNIYCGKVVHDSESNEKFLHKNIIGKEENLLSRCSRKTILFFIENFQKFFWEYLQEMKRYQAMFDSSKYTSLEIMNSLGMIKKLTGCPTYITEEKVTRVFSRIGKIVNNAKRFFEALKDYMKK